MIKYLKFLTVTLSKFRALWTTWVIFIFGWNLQKLKFHSNKEKLLKSFVEKIKTHTVTDWTVGRIHLVLFLFDSFDGSVNCCSSKGFTILLLVGWTVLTNFWSEIQFWRICSFTQESEKMSMGQNHDLKSLVELNAR